MYKRQDQEIADADCIIVAADAKVPMERFDGKHVIECQVSDGISKAEELIDRDVYKRQGQPLRALRHRQRSYPKRNFIPSWKTF